MLYLSGISISLFLSLLLFSKKGKTLADKVLAVWLVVIAFHLLEFYTYISGSIYEYPALLGLGMPLPLLHGPFLYLYVATLTGRLPAIRASDLLHFLPAVLSYLYLISFFMLPAEEKILVFQNKGKGHETFMLLNVSAIILSGIAYVAWSLVLLRKHRRSILDQFSATEKINLRWLQYLIYGIALIWVFVILSMDTFVFSTSVLLVLFIGYFGHRQVGIFTHTNPPSPDSEVEGPTSSPPSGAGGSEDRALAADSNRQEPKKYSKSGLTEEAAARLHSQLSELMEKEKIFRESELTLAILAGRLNTAPNYLSQVINEREGKNFYDYINTLRIEEFKKEAGIPENRKFTILGMAYDCGFNSKSSFNKYFKKVTGISPMEYVKQVEVTT